MIKFGFVEDFFVCEEQLIVSIFANNQESKIVIGSVIKFEYTDKVVVKGMKFWPDKNIFDLLVDVDMTNLAIGDSVYLDEKKVISKINVDRDIHKKTGHIGSDAMSKGK